MKENYIDLHMHSNYSTDGEFTPAQLVELCYAANVKIMALTDHNSMQGVAEAKKKADELGIILIEAIEMDCTYQGVHLHVVGYGVDDHNPEFNLLGERIKQQELKNSEKKIKLVNKLGFDISREQMDQVAPAGIYTGEMFCEVLLKDARYTEHELLKPYRAGGSRSANPFVNFHWDYFAQGKPCYMEVTVPLLKDIIKLTRENGGVAVLAHPGNNLKGKFELFDEMVREGIQGVECFSSYHSDETAQYFYNKAKQLNLLYTCGSDFHGKTKPAVHIKESGCTCPDEIQENLKKFHLIES